MLLFTKSIYLKVLLNSELLSSLEIFSLQIIYVPHLREGLQGLVPLLGAPALARVEKVWREGRWNHLGAFVGRRGLLSLLDFSLLGFTVQGTDESQAAGTCGETGGHRPVPSQELESREDRNAWLGP